MRGWLGCTRAGAMVPCLSFPFALGAPHCCLAEADRGTLQCLRVRRVNPEGRPAEGAAGAGRSQISAPSISSGVGQAPYRARPGGLALISARPASSGPAVRPAGGNRVAGGRREGGPGRTCSLSLGGPRCHHRGLRPWGAGPEVPRDPQGWPAGAGCFPASRPGPAVELRGRKGSGPALKPGPISPSPQNSAGIRTSAGVSRRALVLIHYFIHSFIHSLGAGPSETPGRFPQGWCKLAKVGCWRLGVPARIGAYGLKP